MIKLLSRIAVIMVLCFTLNVGLSAISSQPAYAQDPPAAGDECDPGIVEGGCDCISTSFNILGDECQSGGDGEIEDSLVFRLLIFILNFLAIGVGIAVVGGIVWGATIYIQSNGDAGKAQQGVHVIVNAVIGLVLFIFLYSIANYFVPGGLFN